MKNNNQIINIKMKSSVSKHHDLVQIYYPSSGANEQKIFNYILYCIKENKVKDGHFITSFKEINDFLGFKLNHKQMVDNFTKLMSVVIKLGLLNKKKKKWTLVHLIDKVDYDNGILKIFLPNELVSIVENDEKSYCRLNFELINTFNSKYTIRLYENLVRYMTRNNKFIHMPKMEISTFRKLMGIKDNQYKRMAHLKSKVIDVAVNEINNNKKIDIEVEYGFFKSATKYTHILFTTNFKYENSPADTALFFDDKNLLTFVDKFLPKHADKKVVGYIDNQPIYYYKKNKQFKLKKSIGEIILNVHTSMEVMKYCYESRKTFEWYNQIAFEQMIYEQKQEDTKEYFENLGNPRTDEEN